MEDTKSFYGTLPKDGGDKLCQQNYSTMFSCKHSISGIPDGGSRVGVLSSQLTSKIQKGEAIDKDHRLGWPP